MISSTSSFLTNKYKMSYVTNIHRNTSLNNQKVETTQISMFWWLDNQISRQWNIIQPPKGMEYWYILTCLMNIETLVLSERSKSQRFVWLHSYTASITCGSVEVGHGLVVARIWGGRNGSCCLRGVGFLFLRGRCSKLNCHIGCTAVWIP